MSEEEISQLRERMRTMANELAEYADAVAILCSVDQPEKEMTSTLHATRGSCHTVDGLLWSFENHRRAQCVKDHFEQIDDE